MDRRLASWRRFCPQTGERRPPVVIDALSPGQKWTFPSVASSEFSVPEQDQSIWNITSDLSKIEAVWMDERTVINTRRSIWIYPSLSGKAEIESVFTSRNSTFSHVCAVSPSVLVVAEMGAGARAICVHTGKAETIEVLAPSALCSGTPVFEPTGVGRGNVWFPGKHTLTRFEWHSPDCIGPGKWSNPKQFNLPAGISALACAVTADRSAPDKKECFVLMSRGAGQSMRTRVVSAYEVEHGATWNADDLTWQNHWQPEILLGADLRRWIAVADNEKGRWWWVRRAGVGGAQGLGASSFTVMGEYAVAVEHLDADRVTRSWSVRPIDRFKNGRPSTLDTAMAPRPMNAILGWSGGDGGPLSSWVINPATTSLETLVTCYAPAEALTRQDRGPVFATPTGVGTFFRNPGKKLQWVFVDPVPVPIDP